MDENIRDKLIKSSVELESTCFDKSEVLRRQLRDVYKKTLDEIQKEIYAFYGKYASQNGMTYQDAVKYLNQAEMHSYNEIIQEYTDKIDTNDLELMSRLDKAAAREKVTRLDGLIASIRNELATLQETEERGLERHLMNLFKESYTGAAAGLKGIMEIKSSFSTINPDLIEETIKFPWSGESFSDIIWDNTDKLARELKSELVQGFIRGTSAHKMSDNLAKKMGNTYSNAQRVVMTESSHVLNKASLMSYADNGVKSVEFLAVLDWKTSSLCFNLNGDIIDIEDAVPGKNIPPLHPHCRSTIIPVVDEN